MSPCLLVIVLLCVTLYVCNAPVRKNNYADYCEVKLKINQSIMEWQVARASTYDQEGKSKVLSL